MLTFITAGESHGPLLTTIVSGFPAGLMIDPGQIDFQLARRQKGYGRGGRMKIEQDHARITSGIRAGRTLGSPIALTIENKDWANWERIMAPFDPPPDDPDPREKKLLETSCPRPGHADLAGGIKYHHHDLRNVLERSSARETAARVAAGSLARQLLEFFEVKFASHVVSIGSVALESPVDYSDLQAIVDKTETSEVRCFDTAIEKRMIEEIRQAKKSRDSVGGVVEVIVRGLPAGLGSYSQWSDRLDGALAQTMMSIPSVKGIEIGLGFRSSCLRGSEVHDEIYYAAEGDKRRKGFYRRTNNAGGIEGGITNGEDIILRLAAKPISTLNRPLASVDVNTKAAAEAIVERTDNCAVPALAVVAEAMAAFTLANSFIGKFGGDNMTEISANYQAFLDRPY